MISINVAINPIRKKIEKCDDKKSDEVITAWNRDKSRRYQKYQKKIRFWYFNDVAQIEDKRVRYFPITPRFSEKLQKEIPS